MKRCRCKVAFEMTNFYEFKPHLNRCHLLHFNDNKYRFQSRRDKHKFDAGSIFEPCPMAKMIVNGRKKDQEMLWTQQIERSTGSTNAGAARPNIRPGARGPKTSSQVHVLEFDTSKMATDEYLGTKLPDVNGFFRSDNNDQESGSSASSPPMIYGNTARHIYLRSTE
jgi:hypothetical protein